MKGMNRIKTLEKSYDQIMREMNLNLALALRLISLPDYLEWRVQDVNTAAPKGEEPKNVERSTPLLRVPSKAFR